MEDKSINAGKVGLTMGGDWKSSESYEKLTCVSHNGRSWAAKKNVSAGVEPTEANSAFWQLMSDRGFGYSHGASRPTADLTIGQMFFDTSLGKPIWYKGDNVWVDATGSVA